MIISFLIVLVNASQFKRAFTIFNACTILKKTPGK